jgi:MFS family permease
MSLFPMAIVTLFMRHDIGLSMAQIMGLQAWFGLVAALGEFPAGFVADRIGYRRSMIASSVCALAGWSAFTAADGLWTLALAEALLGVSLSLVSGTDSALLYESLLETGRESEYLRWFGRSQSAGQIGEGSAALLAGALYALSPRLPFAVQIGVYAVALGVALALTEPARHRPLVQSAWAQVRRIVRYAAVEAPRLRAVITASVSLNLCTFVPVWIVALYAEEAGVPVTWLGPIWAIANYTVAIGALSSARVSQSFGVGPTLAGCAALIAAGYLGMGLTYAWWGFAFYGLFTLARGLMNPALSHQEQRVIPSSDRAALLSLRSLIFRGTFVLIGPAVGIALDGAGNHTVLLAASGVAALVLAVTLRWLARTPEPESGPEGLPSSL